MLNGQPSTLLRTMPPGTPSKGGSSGERDIRQFMGRNRRVIESDSSDEDQENINPRRIPQQQLAQPQRPPPQPLLPTPQPLQPAQSPNLPPPQARAEDAIEILSSDDSMYIPPRPRTQNVLQQQSPATLNTPRRQVPSAAHAAINSPRRDQPLRSTPAPKRRRSSPVRNLEGEADSTSESDSNSQADETDQDAAAMYRETILGLRNRTNFVQQVRKNTTPCPVCQLFAQFLRHFV